MRFLPMLVAAVCVLPVWASEPEQTATANAPAAIDSEREVETWIGLTSAEIEAGWGKPVKIKRSGNGQTVYHVKRQHTQLYEIEERTNFLGFARPDDATHGRRKAGLNEAVIATRKAKFWINENGVVVAEKIGKLKWKHGYGPDSRR